MRSENALQREKLDLRAKLRPHMDKIGRGERLSAAEMRDMNGITAELDVIDRAILDQRDGRDASDRVSANDPVGPVTNGAEERAMLRYLKTGTAGPELREIRAAGEATGSAGGYLVPPGWWQRLQVALKAYGGIANDFQQLETKTGQPMQWATVDPTGVFGTIQTENTGITDVDYTFGQGTLSAYMFTGGVQKVSFQLDQDSAFDMGSFITARVGESLGRGIARAATDLSTYGTGTNMPLSITKALDGFNSGSQLVNLTAATEFDSIATGTSTSFGAVTELASGGLAPDTLLKMVGKVDRAYRALGAKWYMNDGQLLAIRRQVDKYGRPLWPSLMDDANPTLLGYPVVVDNTIPALTASTTGGPVFGHMPSAMVLRKVAQDGVSVGLLRLDQRYADQLQVGYIGYTRIDIRSNDLRAAVTVKPAAT